MTERTKTRGRAFSADDIESYKNPLIRKPTLNVQVFADARLIAGLHNYFASVGSIHEPRYSTLLNLLIETVHDMLVRKGKIEPFTSPDAAIACLRSAGYSMEQLKDKTRNRRMQLALLAEDMTEGFDSELQRTRRDVVPENLKLPDDVDPAFIKENLRRIANGQEVTHIDDWKGVEKKKTVLPDYLQEEYVEPKALATCPKPSSLGTSEDGFDLEAFKQKEEEKRKQLKAAFACPPTRTESAFACETDRNEVSEE